MHFIIIYPIREFGLPYLGKATAACVSRFGLAVRHLAGKQDTGLIPHFGLPFSSKVVIYGHWLMTLPCTINAALKCPSFLNAEIILVVTV